MALSIIQNSIKMYVQEKHDRNEKVTIKQISDAYSIPSDKVREHLKAIRKERKKFSDFIKDFGLEDIFKG